MATTNDGGPAFPRPGFEQPAGMQDGMSLRDWFAGQALAGMLAGLLADGTKYSADAAPSVAPLAYTQADAMLAARAKGGDA